MNDRINESQRRRDAAAIAIWDNEGGALCSIENEVGRRVEADRSWTVYHVFTVPVHVDGQAMTGMTRSGAASSMMSLNRRNVGRHKERIRLGALGPNGSTAGNT
ncbi:hypothetical protein J1C56_10035 [Aminobacter anthyllidis]|uniref:Uncharacterized protein n=1 Tax=Aminobacter anthyllidis TaxID=1035067 RepID=A0A9X1D5M6_9HYPH|nr:hypothetical protein [Aminobacter anthyllidis]MBT1155929.1 hypothetical protein [Aminobacter anthyllidis]